jgi:hypothetical protein
MDCQSADGDVEGWPPRYRSPNVSDSLTVPHEIHDRGATGSRLWRASANCRICSTCCANYLGPSAFAVHIAIFFRKDMATVGVDPDTHHCVKNRQRYSLYRRGRSVVKGSDGPRPGVGLGFPAWRAGRFALICRTVRACAGAAEFADGAWISLPGGTPSGGRDPMCCPDSADRPRHL